MKQQTPRAEWFEPDWQSTPNVEGGEAFTLIELLVVISIIIVLMGLLFPAFRGVQDQAKKTQAKNDLTQIVTAVNAFYTEYGKYPLLDQGAEKTLPGDYAQNELMNVLRAKGTGWDDPNGPNLNPRRITFFSPPDAKDSAKPRGGIGTGDQKFYDPWGSEYRIRIDGDYDSAIANPYSSTGGAGSDPIRQGVISWSVGKDGGVGTKGDNVYKTAAGVQSDDVISWQ